MKEYFNIMEIKEYTPQLSGLLFFLPFFVFGLIIVSVLYITGKQKKQKLAIVPLVVFGCLSILFVIGYFTLHSNDELIKLKGMYLNNNYEIVEGIVENFDPMPYGGHKLESFEVNGIKFSYSDYHSTAGYTPVFSKTRSHGGPIYEGLYVKIYYIHDENFNNNFIIRLLADEQSQLDKKE